MNSDIAMIKSFLEGKLPWRLFKAIEFSDDKCKKLASAMKSLYETNKDINATNIFQQTMDKDLVVLYMDLSNSIDKEIGNDFLIKTLEGISGKSHKDLLTEASKHEFKKHW